MPSGSTSIARPSLFTRQIVNPADRQLPDYILQDPIQPTITPISSSSYRSSQSLRSSKAVVIDLGTSNLRAGFSKQSGPHLKLPPIVARTKDVETGERSFLIGYDALISSARSTARTAYDTSGIPNNPALMERLLDGTLHNLGLYDEDRINHNFILTETPCTPNSARSLMMEILFESYCTPGICFGIDGLFSYYYNKHNNDKSSYLNSNALVLSCGFNTTHILPIYNNKLYSNNIKRINLGGSHMTDQLQKRLSLLNNDHSNILTNSRIEKLKESLCYISKDYDKELKLLKQDVQYYNQITKSIKIPMADSSGNGGNDKANASVEDQQKQRQARIENGRRLSEMMREKRKATAAANNSNDKVSPSGGNDLESGTFTEEEVADLYNALTSWYDLHRIEEMKEIDEDKFYVALLVRKYSTAEKFTKQLEKLLENVEKEREKLGGNESNKVKSAEEVWWKKIHEDELLSMSDNELNVSELKKKRHIRALRGAAEARERIKKAKEFEKKEKERKANDLKNMKEQRPDEYLNKLKKERDVLAGRIKKRQVIKESGSDRRSQAARERMRLLAHHAGNRGSVEDGKSQRGGRSSRSRPGAGATGGNGDNNNNKKGKGSGRGGGGKGGKKNGDDDEEDDFGYNDEDWDVYRSMKVGGADSDSEDHSSEERDRLEKVREEITEISPQDVDPTISYPEGVALLYEENLYIDEISISVDRLRAGELLFQPSVAGMEQCGLAEAMNLCTSSSDHRSNIVQEVFITGGVAKMNGMKERVCRELRQMLPSEIGDKVVDSVTIAKDATLDAWKGAAMFAEYGGNQFENSCVTKREYEEMGPGYLKEHAFGNRFYKTPVLTPADWEVKKKNQKQMNKRGRQRGVV